ncbi:hypothetical protein SNEBB_010189 [Seison nebaliae]|nr:hypothetical protein SNEBB_010189 [Seison nebaliae]
MSKRGGAESSLVASTHVNLLNLTREDLRRLQQTSVQEAPREYPRLLAHPLPYEIPKDNKFPFIDQNIQKEQTPIKKILDYFPKELISNAVSEESNRKRTKKKKTKNVKKDKKTAINSDSSDENNSELSDNEDESEEENDDYTKYYYASDTEEDDSEPEPLY